MIQFPFSYIPYRTEEHAYLIGKKRVFQYNLFGKYICTQKLATTREQFIASLIATAPLTPPLRLDELQKNFCRNDTIRGAMKALVILDVDPSYSALMDLDTVNLDEIEVKLLQAKLALAEQKTDDTPMNFFEMVDRLAEMQSRVAKFRAVYDALQNTMRQLNEMVTIFSAEEYSENRLEGVQDLIKHCRYLKGFTNIPPIQKAFESAKDQLAEWVSYEASLTHPRLDKTLPIKSDMGSPYFAVTRIFTSKELVALNHIGQLDTVYDLLQVYDGAVDLESLSVACRVVEASAVLPDTAIHYLQIAETCKEVEIVLLQKVEQVNTLFYGLQDETLRIEFFSPLLAHCQETGHYGTGDVTETQFVEKLVKVASIFNGDDAISLCQQALKKNPNLFEVYVLLADLYEKRYLTVLPKDVRNRNKRIPKKHVSHTLLRGLCHALYTQSYDAAKRLCDEVAHGLFKPESLVQQLAQLQYYHISNLRSLFQSSLEQLKTYYSANQVVLPIRSGVTFYTGDAVDESRKSQEAKIHHYVEALLIQKAVITLSPDVLENYPSFLLTQENLSSVDDAYPQTKLLFWNLKYLHALIRNKNWEEAKVQAEKLVSSQETLREDQYNQLTCDYLGAAKEQGTYPFAILLANVLEKQGLSKVAECATVSLFAASLTSGKARDEALAQAAVHLLDEDAMVTLNMQQIEML